MSEAKQPRQESKGYAERLSGNLKPTPHASTYVKPDAMEWKPSQFEGVEIKVLYENKKAGEMTCLLRWQPGTTLPFHKHPEIEQTFVIEGSFYDHDGICRAGEFVWRRVGSFHETHSDEGAGILAAYRSRTSFSTARDTRVIMHPDQGGTSDGSL